MHTKNVFKGLVVLVITLAMSFWSNSAEAQVSIDENMLISLSTDVGSDIADTYVLDFTVLDIPSEEKATELFSAVRTNLMEFRDIDFASKTVILDLKEEYLGTTWTTAEWNTYFSGTAANMLRSKDMIIE
jgi:hypothetical protein